MLLTVVIHEVNLNDLCRFKYIKSFSMNSYEGKQYFLKE